MAFAVVSHTSAQVADVLTTSAIDTTGADLLIAVGCSFSHLGPFSDSKGNTWHALTSQQSGPPGVGAIAYAWNATVGSGHTFSYGLDRSSGDGFNGLAVAAFYGSQTSSDPFDVQNGSSTGSASSLATGSVTPGVNNELLIFGATGSWGAHFLSMSARSLRT
jgi:hypothetical protein